MPAFSDHLLMADRCRAAINVLHPAGTHDEWIVTIAFYEALHLVEAVAANNPSCRNDRAVTHDERREFLQKHALFAPVRSAFKELYSASRIARYMHGGPQAFTNYFAKPNLHQLVIVQWLGSVRRFAADQLGIAEIANPPAA